MKFRSTRYRAPASKVNLLNHEVVTASEAIGQGLAKDGGLFVPWNWDHLIERNHKIIERTKKGELCPFPEFACQLLGTFFEGDLLAPHLGEICAKAFQFPIPLVSLAPHIGLLELFHGPTHAFKDFGARFLALCLNELGKIVGERQISQPSPRKLVLVATSGDTGGAVASAFCEFTEIPVVILYPKGKISPRQEAQLTGWGDQVCALAVEGSFDDCQRIVKEAFMSESWKKMFELISANSINLGRLLPQVAYLAYSSLQAFKQFRVPSGFIIPSGNVGNAVSGLWAQKLGYPLREIIFAHNANETVSKYFETGNWKPEPSRMTLANAMDVGAPSNFERVLDLYPLLKDLKDYSSAFSISDEEIREEIQEGPKNWGQIWCPHTAVAVRALSRLGVSRFEVFEPWVLVATAHPAKFESIVEPLIGRTLNIPTNLKDLLKSATPAKALAPSLQALESHLLKGEL